MLAAGRGADPKLLQPRPAAHGDILCAELVIGYASIHLQTGQHRPRLNVGEERQPCKGLGWSSLRNGKSKIQLLARRCETNAP